MDGFGSEEHREEPFWVDRVLEVDEPVRLPIDPQLDQLLAKCFPGSFAKSIASITNVLVEFSCVDVSTCAEVGRAIDDKNYGTQAVRNLLDKLTVRLCGASGKDSFLYDAFVKFFRAALALSDVAAAAAKAEELKRESAAKLHHTLSLLSTCPVAGKRDYGKQLLQLFFGDEKQPSGARYLATVAVDENGNVRCPWLGCEVHTYYTWKFPNSSDTHHRLLAHMADKHFPAPAPGTGSLHHVGHSRKRRVALLPGQQQLALPAKEPRSEAPPPVVSAPLLSPTSSF